MGVHVFAKAEMNVRIRERNLWAGQNPSEMNTQGSRTCTRMHVHRRRPQKD